MVSVTDLAEPFEMSLPAVSKHLKVLEAKPLRDVASWVERYRRLWEARFDRLDDYLRKLQAKEKKHGHRKE